MATHGLPAWPWADTETEALPPAEALLLEGMRRWALAARTGAPTLAAMRLPFIVEDAQAALRPLDALMRAVSANGMPGIACPLCPRATPSEAELLLALALAQRGCRSQALGLLLRYLPPAAAYTAMPEALHVGVALRAAGLLLRNPLRMR
ncbi:hypothetical protein [Belnapia rosea]|uniref:Uncharacterized protein n=1 Tax=Belnapia rosea TaxID=938405 RepID=A0A1G6L1K3_9PROT|nr:hypothetical protein [Belnapia rosea]SDC37027.1 hypothetical protein SAMN04487779_1001723 [Belnapia rosea]